MGATRATLRSNIQKQYGDTSGVNPATAEIDVWIQKAHDRIARRVHYHILTGTADLVANQPDYAITYPTANFYPLRIDEVSRLADAGTQYYRMTPLEGGWPEYRQRMDGIFTTTTPTSTGTPKEWVLRGETIWLIPCPSYAEANGLKIVASCRDILDDDADTTHVPNDYEWLIEAYCLAQWHEKSQDMRLAAYYREQFKQGLGELISDYGSNRSIDVETLRQP